MRTRRSRRNQDILFRDIGRQLARAASAPAASPAPPGLEADLNVYACPDGPHCHDPECIAEFARRQAVRHAGVRLPGWVPYFPGPEEQPGGGHLFQLEELLPHGVMRLRRIRPDGSVSKNPADLAYSTVGEVFRT